MKRLGLTRKRRSRFVGGGPAGEASLNERIANDPNILLTSDEYFKLNGAQRGMGWEPVTMYRRSKKPAMSYEEMNRMYGEQESGAPKF